MAPAFKALWKSLRSAVFRARLLTRGRAALRQPGIDRNEPLPARSGTGRSPPGPPRTLGNYRLDRELGRGAMGAVYMGHDTRDGRPAAIKTVSLGREFRGDELDEARERFFRESETAGLLQHPDIVTIYGAGEDGDLAYIAMEFVTGHDLNHYANATRLLPLPVLLPIVARVAEALAYAHERGVVHRDIKPANVMVDVDNDLVKITDFGVARTVDTSRTRSGVVLGTPAYMSPEQMAGGRADGRSDLYSLGVLLFQLLTGRLPHRADSMAELMYGIANHEPPDVRTFRPELPRELADVVTLALEKRPEVRYADGHQFAADLRAVAAQIGTLPAGNALNSSPEEPLLPHSQGTIPRTDLTT